MHTLELSERLKRFLEDYGFEKKSNYYKYTKEQSWGYLSIDITHYYTGGWDSSEISVRINHQTKEGRLFYDVWVEESVIFDWLTDLSQIDELTGHTLKKIKRSGTQMSLGV